MIDHFGINVADMERASAFYDTVLGSLGHRRLMDFGVAIGYGTEQPVFWISGGEAAAGPNREWDAVDARRHQLGTRLRPGRSIGVVDEREGGHGRHPSGRSRRVWAAAGRRCAAVNLSNGVAFAAGCAIVEEASSMHAPSRPMSSHR